ncbi:MAG TPA: helix-hairpin-helix domain-containing protein [Bacteroidales bacterium]|nr:helix-hairpin-helix domain-containing protein [Bacteroidales bacterium]
MKITGKWLFTLVFGILTLFSGSVKAQIANDSLSRLLSEYLARQLEELAENSDENADFTDLLDAYLFYSEQKIDLNGPQVNELEALRLLNSFQLERLLEYRKQFGPLLSVYELGLIEGFDVSTLEVLLPIVTVGDGSKKQRLPGPLTILKRGRSQVMTRYERVLETREGYRPISDSALGAKPDSRYLGSPDKYFVRYQFNYRNRVRAGVVMEKDPGEIFLVSAVRDTLRSMLTSKPRNGFDFYSAHFFVRDIGVVKALAIGDYHLNFGQGLTLWSGLSFGKSTEPSSVMRYGQGIRPSASLNEALFMRGIATTIAIKQFDISLFYSHRPVDANVFSVIDSLAGEEFLISSIQETGLHRTVSEFNKKHATTLTAYGGRLNYRSRRLELGYTAYASATGLAFNPREYPYNKFRINDGRNSVQGADFRLIFPHIVGYGEISRSENGGMAGLAGFTAQPAGFVTISMAYRNYGKLYQNDFSTAFAENTYANNERGFYGGIVASLAPGWKLTAFADHFSFPWLRYLTDGPSFGHDYYFQLDRRFNRRADAYLRYRTKTRMKDFADPWNYIDYQVNYTRQSLRFHLNTQPLPGIALRNRIEMVHYEEANTPASVGYLIYQDVIYRPSKKPYELTFRYMLFDAPDYDSRLYVYENDVLYAFSIPMFYDRGTRTYLMLRVRAGRDLDFWARIGQTWYADRNVIGSGLETINGNRRTDLKLQLRYKF